MGADPVFGFDGFGDLSADSTYGQEIRLEVELEGGAPDELELLVRTPGDESSNVFPVEPSADGATYVWNTAANYVVPNTLVTYQWRAIDGDTVALSEEATIRYEDDRSGLDWQEAELGEATVHWYGDAEGQARRFGELTAPGVSRGEELLGTELAGPVDVFLYDSREEFFEALGPGAREWTGAAAYPELRTIFMWLGGGSPSYLEIAMLHEVTHIVFNDATDNPFHEPARWLNEGIATWSECPRVPTSGRSWRWRPGEEACSRSRPSPSSSRSASAAVGSPTRRARPWSTSSSTATARMRSRP